MSQAATERLWHDTLTVETHRMAGEMTKMLEECACGDEDGDACASKIDWMTGMTNMMSSSMNDG